MATASRSTDDPDAAARQAQLVRGVGAVLLTAAAAGAGAMSLDSGLELPGWVRGLLLVGWLGLAGGLIWQWVVKPLSNPLPKDGSRPTVGSAARAAFAAVALLTPLGFIPGAGERVQRFLLPWHTPLPDTPYRVVVSSGSTVVARGKPITLAAYLERIRPNASLPETAALVVRSSPTEPESREVMVADGSAAFRSTRTSAEADFEYCVEVGGIRSEWFTVAVADPVELTEGTTLSVRPPEYAEGVLSTQSLAGFRDLVTMPAGRVALSLRFNRPATDARLEWQPTGERGPSEITLRLEPDRTGGAGEFLVPGEGVLSLTLTGDRGLRTEWHASLRSTPDAPPKFETVAGVTATVRDARPDDRVPIELAAGDDVQIARVRVEYRIVGREADVRSETVPLPGLRSKHVEGAFAFSLAGKVRDGESLQFRLRVSDNRSVPGLNLAPQDALFPPDGWATLRVTPSARPLAEQEIYGQRDRVRSQLAAAAARATEAATATAGVREASSPDGPLAVDQVVRLRAATDAAGQAASEIESVAAEVGLTPTLRPLATQLRTLAVEPIRGAIPLLKSAEADAFRVSRNRALAEATSHLAAALKGLSDVGARNESLAATRFDRHRLLELAADQLALAEEAGRPDAKPPEFTVRQRDLSARLNQITAGSPPLRSAVAFAAADELRGFQARIRELANDQLRLNRAIAETEQSTGVLRLEELVAQQRDLRARSAQFGARTETAARLARAAPLPLGPFDASLDRLRAGKPIDALSEQVRAAWELDRLADALTQAVAERRDRREAARQVALWQDNLRSRLEDAARKAPGGILPDEVRNSFAVEQRAIREAVERLHQPDADAALSRAEVAAKTALTAACEALERKPSEALATVKQAAVAIDKFAELTPGVPDRLKRAKIRLDQLRRDEIAISREADDAIAMLPKPQLGERLNSLAKDLAELGGRVRALDLPGHEMRREAAAASAGRAAEDLRVGFTADVPIAVQDLHRRLERLRQAADGQPPPDETAGELARLTKLLAESAGRLPARPTGEDLKPLQQSHREIQRHFAGLTAPEHASLMSELRRAIEDLGTALRPGEPVIELRRTARRAVDAATVLADRLTETQSDAQRAARLAQEWAASGAVPSVDRQLEELALIRAGKATAAKKAATDAMNSLRQTKEPDRRTALQQVAAEVLKRFAGELAAQERQRPMQPTAPPRPDSDDLRTLTGNGRLPTTEDAKRARELARLQTELRNATSEAAAELARGTRPIDRDDLGPLAKQSAEFAGVLRRLPQGDARDTNAGEALSRAANELRDGRLRAAQAAVTEATEAIAAGPERGDVAHCDAIDRLGKLATRLSELGSRFERLRQIPAVETARQLARQAELIANADRLIEAIREASDPAEPEAVLAKVLSTVTQARTEMAQAARDAGGERPAAATAARNRAIHQLELAATRLSDAVREALAITSLAPVVGEPLRKAGSAMRRAESELANGKLAAGSMRSAAEAVSRAAEVLTESMTKPK